MHLQLLIVGCQLRLGLLQFERELCRSRAVARFQVRLGFRLELLHVRAVRRDLASDALDEAAVLLQPGAPFLQLLDGAIVLVPHLRDRVRLPEQIRDLVDLSDEGRPELVKNHVSPDSSMIRRGYCLRGSRSPAPGASARILPW